MKEQLYTIPLHNAFSSKDECPFCYIERNLEQHALNFVLGCGASYMESNIRDETDELGFCRMHLYRMYQYGNRLGSGLILSTYIKKKNQELETLISKYQPKKISPLSRLKKKADPVSSLSKWIAKQTDSCYICNYIENTFFRYMDTFFALYKKDEDFVKQVKDCKGFCIPHFGNIMQSAETHFSEKEMKIFFPVIASTMIKNMYRVQEDMEWFCEKFDYRNKDADWRNSKDALTRTMQKMKGGHPADPPFTQDL